MGLSTPQKNNNSQLKEWIKIGNSYFELNDDENTIYQKLRKASKAVLKGKFIWLNTGIKKKKKKKVINSITTVSTLTN